MGIRVPVDYSDPEVSLRGAYSFALSSDPHRLHFAAHSHHLWPDCTRVGHTQAWEDAAAWADEKWDRVFGKIVPQSKVFISRLLGGVSDSQICLAPNTHEFVYRLFSCFSQGSPTRVLTTDGEFHSFSRQVRRLEEAGQVVVKRVAVEPFQSFAERWEKAARKGPWDLVFLSHVFFKSGHALPDIASFYTSVPEASAFVVDGYHAFCALPISLGNLGKKIFYLAGGYKYAQAGEGVCFLSVPEQCEFRPLFTGWFAAYKRLEAGGGEETTGYDSGGNRFAGATMDFTAAYRFNAVQQWWNSIGLTVDQIHRRVTALKLAFIDGLGKKGSPLLDPGEVLREGQTLPQGHFIVFKTPKAAAIAQELKKRRIVVDYRGDRLRVGFGLYHDMQSVQELLERLGPLVG
jgi:selenocysteine lyase/cysteine desulfurase